VQDLAAGRNEGLAKDFPEVEKQKAIGRAVVALAVEHETMGLSSREAKIAREKLIGRDNTSDQGWEL
jgi:hypothetical protein